MSVSLLKKTRRKRKEKQRNDVSDIFTGEDMGNISLVSRMCSFVWKIRVDYFSFKHSYLCNIGFYTLRKFFLVGNVGYPWFSELSDLNLILFRLGKGGSSKCPRQPQSLISCSQLIRNRKFLVTFPEVYPETRLCFKNASRNNLVAMVMQSKQLCFSKKVNKVELLVYCKYIVHIISSYLITN